MYNSSISPEKQAVAHSTANGLVVLSVSAGGEMFAIDVRNVREIHAWVPPVPLPGAPHYVQGILNLWGDVVPLVVLACRLGLPDTRSSAPVTVMIEREDDVIGLVVDTVCDLHSIAVDQLSVTPMTGIAESARLLRGVITLDHGLMCLIDVEKMLPATAIPADTAALMQDPIGASIDPAPVWTASSEVNRVGSP
jgi:purine-binding chemotaxis protein CheW